MNFKAIVRSDANSSIGMGHLVRDLELVKKLSQTEQGEFVFFIGGGDKRARDFISHQGAFHYIEVPAAGEEEFLTHHLSLLSPQLSIIDVLVRDQEDAYMNIFSDYSRKVVAITDDSLPRYIKADVVFNGNPNQKESYYQGSNGTYYYVGPQFFILNPSFAQVNVMHKEIKVNVENILVAFGGADNYNAPLKVAQALAALSSNAQITFLLSPLYDRYHELNEYLKGSPLHYETISNVRSVLPLLTKTDLMLCSAGNICFEASAVGAPLILMNQVQRQNEIAQAFAQKTFVKNLGMVAEVSQGKLQETISEVVANHSLRKKMSLHQKQFVDGRGLERVSEIITHLFTQ